MVVQAVLVSDLLTRVLMECITRCFYEINPATGDSCLELLHAKGCECERSNEMRENIRIFKYHLHLSLDSTCLETHECYITQWHLADALIRIGLRKCMRLSCNHGFVNSYFDVICELSAVPKSGSGGLH